MHANMVKSCIRWILPNSGINGILENIARMNLLKALAAIGSMTFISRVLGFVRDLLIARVFGAGAYTDAFFVAFKIPNLLRRLFAEGAFSQAFVPILAEYKNQ